MKFFEEILLNSDVIIYDLLTCDPKEAEFAISTLKLHPFVGQKTLICLSNVMTWARCKPKEKREDDEADDNPLEEPDSEEENAN